MVNDASLLRQRELNFTIVDEVDSILIDEARTPLIISAPAAENPDSYYQFAKIAAKLVPDDYILDEKHRTVSLSDDGIDKVQKMLGIDNLYSPEYVRSVYHMEQALRAQTLFKRDKDYVVTKEGEVIIVDEFTGRLMQGRRYNEGLHQAIEAKEAVPVLQESMSIYLKTDTTDEVGNELKAEVEALSSVKSVTYISANEARDQIAQENSDNSAVLDAIKVATNMNPATLRVVVKDINDTSELEKFVSNDDLVKEHLNADYAPSFAGERRDTIKSIGRVVNFIQEIGIIVGVVFVAISSLIIFNTISMAIFNRREEIQMMNLIGANKSFVRGPFLIESIIYGLIAALIASGIGLWGLYKSSGILASYEVSVQPTIDLASKYIVVVVLAMIAVGSIIGIISSTLATRKYLKS